MNQNFSFLSKNFQLCILFIAASFLTACSDREDGPSEIINARPVSPYYFVKKGETLADVATKHSMTEDEIIALNNLKSPYTLFERQRILVRVIGKNNAGYLKSDGEITVKELDADDEKNADKKDDDADDDTDDKEAVDPLSSSENGASNNLTLKNSSKIGGQEAVSGIPSKQASIKGASGVGAASASVGFSWPVKGKILTNFGQKMPDGTVSDSIYIKAPVGTKIKAAAAGKVQKAGETLPGLGKIVSIKHSDGKMSIYAHLKEVSVKPGQELAAGQNIGRVGKYGSEPMLFFQVRKQVGKKFVPTDPMQFLP